MLRPRGQMEPVERVGYGPGLSLPVGEDLAVRIPGGDIGDMAVTYQQRARGELHRD